MKLEDVDRRLKHIESISVDDERAHVEQDKLWADVLRATAKGADEPALLARRALDVLKIEFYRWFA
jgi:hypothetical protein